MCLFYVMFNYCWTEIKYDYFQFDFDKTETIQDFFLYFV